ncbi:MAG TPA: PTS sugar transporter subunit IIA [Gemmatimonadales bacterium]|nr:PTS sugar transporter subunit IIA [Gemmatimonadales bacterium]
MLLTDLLTPDRVVVPLAARDKAGAIRELAERLAERAGGSAAEIVEAVQEREAMLSTGIGHGIAIPHGRSPAVKDLGVVAGVSAEPIPYDALDGEPVRLFFLLVGPETAAGQHVKVLARIARLLRRDELREALLAARTPEEFHAALADADVR